MTHVRNTPFHGFTPWGGADHVEQKAEGIWFASTPSHGGFWISPERLAAMPAKYRVCSLTNNHWFEEDCAWCAVALTFPEAFSGDEIALAGRTYLQWYANKPPSIQASPPPARGSPNMSTPKARGPAAI